MKIAPLPLSLSLLLLACATESEGGPSVVVSPAETQGGAGGAGQGGSASGGAGSYGTSGQAGSAGQALAGQGQGGSGAGAGGSGPSGAGGSPGGGQGGAGAGGQVGVAGAAGQGGAGQGGLGAGASGAGASGAGAGGTGGAGQGGGPAGQGGAPALEVPPVPPEPPAACEAAKSGDYFQFLDDVCGAKKYPTHVDRGQVCPVEDASATVALVGGGEVTYQPASAPVVVDGDALKGVVPDDVWMTVILVKRVGGVPHYRYVSNGFHDVAHQPWSTTKFLAAANAASRLRIASGYKVGLTASVSGLLLGDLVTTMHKYDNNPYSSNAMGRYFHDVGGRQRANDLIHGLWLERPAGETFGGNYGEPSPPLGYTFTEADGASVSVDQDTSAGPANKLSGLTVAEALKRLVMHREDAGTRLPGIQWADVETLLHGAASPEKYSSPWGGMSADTAIYLQSGHDPAYIEERSQGRWRVFSKLGLGTDGTFLDVGYACYPALDGAQKPILGWGREFVIAARQQTGGAGWRERDRLLARHYRAVVTRILDGRL